MHHDWNLSRLEDEMFLARQAWKHEWHDNVNRNALRVLRDKDMELTWARANTDSEVQWRADEAKRILDDYENELKRDAQAIARTREMTSWIHGNPPKEAA
jgi:hypothetical protein